MKRLITPVLFACFVFLLCFVAASASVRVVVEPNVRSTHSVKSCIPDSLHFRKGEQVSFKISVFDGERRVTPTAVTITFNEDKMTPSAPERLLVTDQEAFTPVATMSKSGFLRCNAEAVYGGKTYKGHSMVGFDVQELQPTVRMPADFMQWWTAQLDTAAKIPMKPEMRLLPGRCTKDVDVYEVSVQAVEEGFRVHGILCVPKADGVYPAVMRAPGAGVHKIGGMVDEAANGVITLDMGVHGLPLTKPDKFYADLSAGKLKDYPTMNIESRERYYYRRVYLSAVRLAEFLTTLPKYDGKNLYVCGGSQGGAISIVTAALCPKVKAIEVFFPALADQEAYLHDRAGGWPHYFYFHKHDSNIDAIANVVQYYDVANFARVLRTPVFMSFGLADLTCAPTCTSSTWNAIGSADKQLVVTPQVGHRRDLKVWEQGWKWMLGHHE